MTIVDGMALYRVFGYFTCGFGFEKRLLLSMFSDLEGMDNFSIPIYI